MKKNIGLISAVVIALTFLLLSFTSLPYWVQAKSEPQNERGRVLYVSSSGSGGCTSWADACDLQAAITTAVATDEIWVQAGTYLPTNTNNRAISFQLKEGVALYGGFDGTETAFEERDWLSNITILSGDISTPVDNSDNSYHVVYSTELDSTAILDGFTITAGNANGISLADRGGGMFNYLNSSPTLINLTFSTNLATYGGGMFNGTACNPTLTHVTFSNNSAIWGGGMYNNHNSTSLANVTFSDNSANYGGGMVNNNDSDIIMTNVTISNNSADVDGGGMYNWDRSDPTLTNVTLSSNSADGFGGGMFNNSDCNPILINSIVWGNTSDQIFNNASTPVITYSDIQGGYAGTGNINLDPLLGLLTDNGGYTLTHALLAGSPAIDTGSPTVCPATDQRGVSRPIDGDLDLVPRCDMGAYEYEPIIYIYLPFIIN